MTEGASQSRVLVWARWAVILLCALHSAKLLLHPFTAEPFIPDYTVFWTAGREALSNPGILYRFEEFTRAQLPLTHPDAGPRPWAYPPSALLLFVPAAVLPFWWSFVAWNALSAAAYLWSVRRWLMRDNLFLVLLSAPIVFALISGQTSLLIAAAIIAGLGLLPRSPVAAGALLGVAASVKPQALVMAPVALIAAREWKALGGFVLGGAVMAAASLAFGFQLWLDWFAALGEFNEVLVQLQLQATGITPAALAYQVGASDLTTAAIQCAGIIAGTSFVWWAFRRNDLDVRVVALVTGALLSVPYAMRYEIVAVVPFAIKALLSRKPWGIVAGLPVMGAAGILTVPALAFSVTTQGKANRRDRQPISLTETATAS